MRLKSAIVRVYREAARKESQNFADDLAGETGGATDAGAASY